MLTQTTAVSPFVMVAGEALVDLIQQPDGRYLPVAGGSLFNVAIATANLGTPVEFLARIGTDLLGQLHIEKLQAYGVGQTYLTKAQSQTTLAVASLDDAGSASYSFYLAETNNTTWEPSNLPPAEIRPIALHIGSISLTITTGELLSQYARQLFEADQTTITFDANYRPGVGGSVESEAERVLQQLESVHIFKASDEDIQALFPGVSAQERMREFARKYGIHVVLTQGSAGVFSVRPDGSEFLVPTRPANPLVDTVGAGDTFWGAMLSELFRQGTLGSADNLSPHKRLLLLPDTQWESALNFAAVAASLVCERAGAQPPNRAEVTAALA